MTKIDPVQLEKDIDAIPGICKEGKEAVKKLFANNFGVEFKKPDEFFDKALEVFVNYRGSGRDSLRAVIKFMWESIEWREDILREKQFYIWKPDLAKKWGIQDA